MASMAEILATAVVAEFLAGFRIPSITVKHGLSIPTVFDIIQQPIIE
jgi:hypothetical protein